MKELVASSSLQMYLPSVSPKALNFSSRMILSCNLDYKQVLPSENGFARDYRGLAEQMGFQYRIIKRIGESESPTMKILELWETRPDATLDKLIKYLEEMGRFDVVSELTPFLEKNVEIFLQDEKSVASQQLQVAEGARYQAWRKMRRKFRNLNLTLKEKGAQFFPKSKCVKIDDVKPWPLYMSSKKLLLHKKVSIFVGDITALEVDAIVSATNTLLKQSVGGTVNGAIHRAAGPRLLEECKSLKGCDLGDAKVTRGYELPARYVIHTVGPFGERQHILESCYRKSLTVAIEKKVRTIAFPCISTGNCYYPREKAAEVAVSTVREVLEKNESSFDRIIFCLFLPDDVGIYEGLLQEYFPV